MGMNLYLPIVERPPDPQGGAAHTNAENAEEFARLWSTAPWQERRVCIPSPKLMAAAQWSAEDYAKRNYAGHQDSQGRSPNRRVRDFNYHLTVFYPEDGNNIESMCVWWKSAAEALDRLYNSPGHYPHVSGHDAFFRIHTRYGVGSAAGAWYVLITAPPEMWED